MQRLHQDDLVGHVLEQGRWEVLSLPAIAEVNECHLSTGRSAAASSSECLATYCIRRGESVESLANTRRAISEFNFASQYQQNPISLERLNAIDAESKHRFSKPIAQTTN